MEVDLVRKRWVTKEKAVLASSLELTCHKKKLSSM